MRLAIVGPSRCGKSHAAHWLARNTSLLYWGSCSRVILPHAAAHLGISEAAAFACRHEHRPLWRALGDALRRDDPAHLARKTLEHGDLCVGVRSLVEIEAVRAEGLCDLIVWVERDVPADDTLEYDSSKADIIVENRWDLPAFHRRLDRLAGGLCPPIRLP